MIQLYAGPLPAQKCLASSLNPNGLGRRGNYLPEMAAPPGLEPGFLPSEGNVLSNWTTRP